MLTYTVIVPELKVIGVDDRGTVTHLDGNRCLYHDDEEEEVVESLGCEYANCLVFATERDLRNVLFWCMNSAIDDPIYGIYFRDPSVRCRTIVVRDTGGEMGNGLFATEDIACPMTPSADIVSFNENMSEIDKSDSVPVILGEYTGLLVNSSEVGSYSMSYYVSTCNGFDQNWQIDAKEYGNYMRFINHSSVAPNVMFKNVFYCNMWHVLVVSTQRLHYFLLTA